MGKLLAQASATVGKLEDGTDGRTSYIHVAYANSADGSVSFSTTDPTGRAYVGTLTDFVEQDSTKYSDYTWSLVKGSDGKDGANGLPGPKGADGRTSYVHFAYANSTESINYVLNPTGMGASNSARPNVNGVNNTNVTNANITYDTDGMTLKVINPSTEWFYSLINAWTDISSTPLLPGKTYTISVDAMGTVPGVSFRLNDAWVGFYPINNNTWTRVSAKFTNASNATRTYIRVNAATGNVGAANFTAGQTLKLRNFKLEDGSIPGFSTTDSAGKAYVGTLTDFVEPDSTNPADYTWSLIKGADGANGLPGPKGDSVTVTSTSIQYAISTSGTSTPTQWSDSVLAPEQGKFLWTRTTITFSDGTSTVSYSIAFSGSDGNVEELSGIISSDTPPDSPKENQFWNDTSVIPNMLKVYRSGRGWVVYQFSAENIASRAITTDKLSVNAVKAANIDMNEVTYQVSDSSKNLAKNTSFSDASGLGNSTGWTLSSGVKVVQDVLGDTNGILIPAGTTATIVNTLWDNTDAISNYVLGMWIKSAGVVTVTVGGVTSVLGGTHPITTSGDGVWNKKEIKYASTSTSSQLTLTIKVVKDTYLARVMLSRRDTKLDGMWLPAPEDGMLNTAKLNDQVTQNFSLSNGQLKSIISNLNSGYSSSFTQNADGTINQITKGNDLVTAINTSPAGVYIKGDRINLDGTVRVTQDFYALGGNFKNLNASNINAGKLKADYIDVATVVTQGLSTTNASIEKTLTMGNDGLITANLQSQTLNYIDAVSGVTTSSLYTSTGTYKLDKTGFTIFSKSTFVDSKPVVNVGGHGYWLKYYEPKLYMNDATITLSSSNATGQEVTKTSGDSDIPSTALRITPFIVSMTGGDQYTRMFTNGLSTTGTLTADKALIITPADNKYMISMTKGNIMIPGMAGDGSKSKGFRTAHIQWSAWFDQMFDVYREGDMVYGSVMRRARQDIPRDTVSDESLPVGYRPVWQDSVVNIVNYIGRDTGVIVRLSGKLATVGTGMAPYTERWVFSYVTADPFPYGDVYGQ